MKDDKKTTASPEVTPEELKDTAAAEEVAEETPVAAEEVQTAPVTDTETEGAVSADTAAKEDLHGENLTDRAKALSPAMTVLKRFFRSKLSVVGLSILIFLFLFSFIGPLLSPWGETEPDYDNIPHRGTGSEITYVDESGKEWTAFDVVYTDPDRNQLGGISGSHWLGTDSSGYDSFTRLMYGGRVSLTIGFVVVILETLIGVVLGGLAGYFGKWVDNLIMRIVDILSCIPQIPIMLILSAVFDSVPSLATSIWKLYAIMAILCLIGWTGTARLVRGQILSLREQEFMLAAKCSGLSTRKKIFKHLLPNVVPQLIVSMTMGLGSIILMEATLGYLGLGAPPDTATWGNLINLASDSRYRNFYPNLWLPSGLCITLAILAFNFVGDGLRDAFDPKMKR